MIILVFLAFLFGTMNFNAVRAQIYFMDDEEGANDPRVSGAQLSPEGFVIPLMPENDSAYDYTPVGNGIWILGCLGGAYLFGKRRKKEAD